MSLERNTFLWRLACISLIATGLNFPVLADDAATSSSSTQGSQSPSQVTQPAADSPAYQLKLQYTGEAWDNASGGIRTGGTYLQNLDAQLKIDTEKAFGWTGGRFLVEGFYNNGNSITDNFVGSVQDPSIIDTGQQNLVRLYQLYYDQILGNTDVRFGIYDIETEFGITKPMDTFFNGGFAWTSTLDASGQQGLNGPSTYPNTALGLRIRQKIDDQWSVQVAVLDGMADNVNSPQSNDVLIESKYGALVIGEVDYAPIARTKIMVGYWAYTGKFDTQYEFNPDGSVRQIYGSSGAYVGGATRLYTIDGARGLDGFLNIGVADSRVNEVDRQVNFGFNLTGLFDARPKDKLAFGVGIAGSGQSYQEAQLAAGNPVSNYETCFELTYRAKINDWLTVQPDVQYIIHSNFDPALKDDLVFALHFEVSHWFTW